MFMLPYLAVALLVAGVHAMPAEMELEKREGEVGNGAIVQEEMLLPDPDDEEERKKRQYYYYYSSTKSEPALQEAEEGAPAEVIDHAAEGGTGKAPGCLEKYDEMPEPHTMCVYDDEPTVTEYGISKADIDNIVKLHNGYREEEHATDMTQMYWDDEIAVIAQKLAQSCTKGHDGNANRLVPGYNIPIGQNWCGGVKTWDTCLKLWHGEKVKFRYGKKSKSMIGHYTQMVNVKAVGIGCGFAYCPNHHRQNMVCNYAYGQTANDIKKPFTQGEPCVSCPGFCKDGLCDCGSVICKNNGKLNKGTCQCDCLKPYGGDTCDEANCTGKQHKLCGTKSYIAKNCGKYSNLPGICPIECGICPA